MKHLTLSHRTQIETGISQGKSNAQIAREIGVHRATVGREIQRNAMSRDQYSAQQAHRLANVTQRMAVEERGFENYRWMLYSTNKKYEEVQNPGSAKEDYFPMDTYLNNDPFILFPKTNSFLAHRNRYTLHKKYSRFGREKTLSPLFSTDDYRPVSRSTPPSPLPGGLALRPSSKSYFYYRPIWNKEKPLYTSAKERSQKLFFVGIDEESGIAEKENRTSIERTIHSTVHQNIFSCFITEDTETKDLNAFQKTSKIPA